MHQQTANNPTRLLARVIAMTRRSALVFGALAVVLLGAFVHPPEVNLDTTDAYTAVICNALDEAPDLSKARVLHGNPCSMAGACVAVLCAGPDVSSSMLSVQAGVSPADAFAGIPLYPAIKPPIFRV